MKAWVFGKKYWREVSEIAVLHRQRYKKNAPSALLSYISTQEFLRT